MEKDREILKLTNVLRRIARGADYAAWLQERSDAAAFCLTQYNKVLARLTELEPAVAPLFTPLPRETSPSITRMAARELAAYFEDEPRREHMRGHPRARHGCGARVFVGW
ncbi:MAG: hypothetical protein AB1631_25675 [Acidobacteriota bacterium]